MDLRRRWAAARREESELQFPAAETPSHSCAFATPGPPQPDEKVSAVTVDHGLRSESVDEAEFVGKTCKILGIPHDILNWDPTTRSGNLQDAARLARKSMIGAWARQKGLACVLLGHTLDDQAETFLIRLSRGSGVDGLAAMYPVEQDHGFYWLRPLLTVERQRLRRFLKGLDQDWREDPSNEDTRFLRVRMRKAGRLFAELGLDAKTLVATADRMKMARAGLESATVALAMRVAHPTKAGSVAIDLAGFRETDEEFRLRLLSHALKWVASSPYRPRLKSLIDMLDAIETAERAFTLAGCIAVPSGTDRVEICRELAAVKAVPATRKRFDGRWEIVTPEPLQSLEVRPLGEAGLKSCPNWRDLPYSRHALAATPSLWQDDDLIAAPLAGNTNGCVFRY